MKVKRESEDAQLCPTLSNPMDCSLPVSSIHEIFQARVLEWVAMAFSIEYDAVFLRIDLCIYIQIRVLGPELVHFWVHVCEQSWT